MDPLLISLVIPVYNVEPWLPECLDSVIHQTYSNLEILLIDDGSTDGSGVICDEYKLRDHRIRVIHQDHAGLSAARNRGIIQTAGSIIAFLDSDDVMKQNAIKRIWTVMQQTGADIVAFGVESHDGSSIVSSPHEGWYNKQEALRSYTTKDGIASAIWTKAFKNTTLSGIWFREGHNYADGAVFFSALEKTSRLYAIPDQLMRYRKREGSITASNTIQNHMDGLAQTRWICEYAQSVNDGSIDDVVEKLKIAQIANMFGSYSALFDDKSSDSEELKTEYHTELMKVDKTGNIIVDAATMIFRFSPKLFVVLHRISHMIRGH